MSEICLSVLLEGEEEEVHEGFSASVCRALHFLGIQSAFLRLIAHLTPLLIAEVGASHVVCVPTSPFPPHALLIAEMGRRTWYAGRLDSPR